MAKIPILRFNGMNNVVHPEELPLDKASDCVDVQFTNNSELLIPGREYSKILTVATAHSVNNSDVGLFYCDDTSLLRYVSDVSQVELIADTGGDPIEYSTPIGDTVYFSNGTVSGKLKTGSNVVREWGVDVPPSTFTLAEIGSGGMYAAKYRIAITWIGDTESGTTNSKSITIGEGSGIRITNLPTPPSYATKFAVWCSSHEGQDLLLYNEYAIATTSVDISKFKSKIVLDTMQMYPPLPPVGSPIMQHYGRIYWAEGSILRFTHVGPFGPQYELTGPWLYHGPFDNSDILIYVSVPGAIYVGTEQAIYRITNIDSPDQTPIIIDPILNVGAVKGAACYDQNGSDAFFVTHRGIIKVSPEGHSEITFKDVAMPFYESGTMSVEYLAGLRYLTFVGYNGASNPMANSEWLSTQTFPQDSGWRVNLETGAISRFTAGSINRLSNQYGTDDTGLLKLIDYRESATGRYTTGRIDFGSSLQKRLPYCYVTHNGKTLNFEATDDIGPIDYEIPETTRREVVKIDDMARGASGQYWQFSISNKTGKAAVVTEIEPRIITIPRHR